MCSEYSTSFRALAASASDLSEPPVSKPSLSARSIRSAGGYSASTGPRSPATTTFDPSRQTECTPTASTSMSSSAGFPVRTSAMQEPEQGSQASDPACGGNSTGSSPKFARRTRSSKTFQPFALAAWMSCSGASLRSGLTRNGICYPLAALERLTVGTDAGLLRTPVAYDAQPGGPGNHYKGLGWQAKHGHLPMLPTPRPCSGLRSSGANRTEITRALERWQTPRAEDSQSCGGHKGKPDSLTAAVRKWPTPASRDYRYPNARPYSQRGGGKKGEQLPNAVGGPLNPEFVEWLQAFPIGWTDLGLSATPSCRRSRKRSATRS